MQAIGAGVLSIVLVLSAAMVNAGARSARSWFPRQWDPRIAPIAHEVAALRGLDYKHPVQVRYLEPRDFEKLLDHSGDVDAAGRADAQREEAVFRALGFIGGTTDLLKETQTSESSGTLAFYDPTTQMIYVRGTTLDVEHKVTVAHELTHVLQDQNFDLVKLQKRALKSNTGDLSTLKGLVEGDAVRIQEEYLQQLPPAERSEYAREDAAEHTRVGQETSNVPQIVPVLLGAPYEFGPATVRVVVATDGERGINDALTGPTPSSALFVAAGDVEAGVPVDPPTPPEGGVATGQAELFGPFEMFLAMATRLDAARALEAADAVDGGIATTFERDGVVCYSVLVHPATGSAKAFLSRAVRDWSGGRAGTSVDDSGADVGFTACDPGRSAEPPDSSRLTAAVRLLEVRIGLTDEIAKEHGDGDFARCVARTFVDEPGAAALVLAVGNNAPTSEQGARIRAFSAASAAACRDNPDAGLP
jgi:hypothetical protein